MRLESKRIRRAASFLKNAWRLGENRGPGAGASIRRRPAAQPSRQAPRLTRLAFIAPQDGRPPGEVRANTGDHYLKTMGFANNQYVAIRHCWDTSQDPIHIIANRVNLEIFQAINCWQDAVRSQKILRQIERDGLPTAGVSSGTSPVNLCRAPRPGSPKS